MVEELLPDDPHEIAGYALSGRLGTGGMGTVYLSHTRGGQPVALKLIRHEFADNPEFRRRFAQEVEAARRVQGAYTAAVLDSSTDGPQPWLASAYVAGPPLSTAVYDHGRLPVETVLKLAAGMAEALQSIHAAGVVHRDLKPSNVLLASDGPRVIDFGIARAVDATALTKTGVQVGTPAYMSPEQAVGRPVGPAADVFALGLVVFFAATQGHPFGQGGGHELLFRIANREFDLTPCPEPLRPLIASCLAKEPENRPGTDQIIASCRRVADAEGLRLQRADGWWLPRAVADEATARLIPPSAPSSSPRPTEPAAPAEPARQETDRTPHRRWRSAVIGLAALMLGVGGTLAGVKLYGDDDPGDTGNTQRNTANAPSTGSTAGGDTSMATPLAWELKYEDVPVTLQAPPATGGLSCNQATVTGFKADALQSFTTTHYSSADQYTFTYTNCSTADVDPYPDDVNGILLQDNMGVMGVIDQADPTPAECRTAARASALPRPISLASIRRGDPLHQGNGLCIEARNGSLVHLLITDLRPDPEKAGLPTFVMVGTEWALQTS